jgi:hypothetical protein
MVLPEDMLVVLTDPGRLVSLMLVASGLILVSLAIRSIRQCAALPASDRAWGGVATGGLLVIYGLLFTGQYMPSSGDEAYYLCVARTIAQTGRFAWNGIPVLDMPYAWPFVLGMAMRICDSFAFLNLLSLGVVLSLTLWYFILRRWVTGPMACGVVITTGLLFSWQWDVFDLYSEALFFPLLAVGVLLALQIAAGRPWGRRTVALAGVAAGLVFTRFAGIMALPLLAGALLNGGGWPRARQWIAVGVVTATLTAGFFGVRAMVARGAEQAVSAVETSSDTRTVETIRAAVDDRVATDNGMVDRAVKAAPSTYLMRLVRAGTWMSQLVWPPAEFGKTSPTIDLVSNVAGWVLTWLLAVQLVAAARRRQWMWLGIAVYYGAFILVWPVAKPRYVAGVTPMLLLGMWLGARHLAGLRQLVAYRRPIQVMTVGLVLSVLLCNVPLYAWQVCVNQSPQYYGLVMGGEYLELTAVCRELNRRDLADGQLAVARDRRSNQLRRRVTLLTDRRVMLAPAAGQPDDQTLEWARAAGVRYYVCRVPGGADRLMHLRVAGNRPEASFLELYVLGKDRAVPLALGEPMKVDHVPGVQESGSGKAPRAE